MTVKKLITTMMAALAMTAASAQNATISVDANESLGQVSPYVYGQFIEYMGRCIEEGICDPQSPRSRADGIREDVLEKARDLAPTMLRFPGGTFVKTFHWEDGVGPLEQRRPSKNLIWGGINTFRFGTCEFIEYCRSIGAEPVLVVNISTGTPDEAAHWVEYCNGTDNTYYANLRRKHGYQEPFNVKYWALGNEEAAEPDAGRHQDPNVYVKDMWHFIKLMKLTDPTIELIADGERGKPEWNKTVLKGLDGAIDYISFHTYVDTWQNPYSIFERINGVERELKEMAQIVDEYSTFPVKNWQKWYRFPARTKPVKIALDEWGIWEKQEPPYGTTNTYEWRHGLATAWFLNVILRQADHIGMANWAQLVNILAPIMTDRQNSVCQTVFYPMREYRHHLLGETVKASVSSQPLEGQKVNALDAVATVDRQKGTLTLSVVNIGKKDVKTDLNVQGAGSVSPREALTMTATSLDAKNVLAQPDRNVVSISKKPLGKKVDKYTFPAESVTILTFGVK